MKIGDLVKFAKEIWNAPPEVRPLGIVLGVESFENAHPMATVLFSDDDIPYSSKVENFEVINENW